MTRRPKDLAFLCTLLLALVVMASGLAPGRASAADMLLLHEGARTGRVDSYSGGVCMFDGAAVPRAAIYFIGLDAELPPPAPQDAMRDEVHLRDGSVHAGPLVAIDADNVATESALFARKEVAWIWLTPMLGGQGQATPSTTEEEEGPTYEWAGTVAVENHYNGEVGRHLWQAEYRAKFLEVPSGVTPGRVGISADFPSAIVVPLDLAYEFHADQNWDRGSHTLITNAAGKIIFADVTMSGTASGRVGSDRMRDSGDGIFGSIVRVETPLPATQGLPESFQNPNDYYSYTDYVSQPFEPGWYYVYVGIFPHNSPQEERAYYRGIERGGRQPPASPDPDEDFLHWMVSDMQGVGIIGRLDHPDQAEVRGRHVIAAQGPGGPEDRQQITIEWSFTRTRVPDGP